MKRVAAFAAAGLLALSLAACTDYANLPKQLRPLDDSMRALLEQKGMEQKAPILIRIFKEESILEVWKKEKSTARYSLLKSYDICKWSGGLGPKKAEGDKQAPEGFYTITPAQMNPNSSYHLSFNLGYPNDFDRAHGRTGSHLMVHGACSSAGCYSMEDEQIQEIYTLARLAFQGGQRDFQVQAYPFRMTPANIAKHRNDPNQEFWAMLKEGYDHFEVIKQPPKVDVCSQRYVFNSVPQEGVAFSPTGACPPLSVPDPIRVAVAEKEAKDAVETRILVAKLEEKEERERQRAAPAASEVMIAAAPAEAPMSVAAAPVSLEPAPAPAAAILPSAEEAPQAAALAAAEPTGAPAQPSETAAAPPAVATAYMPTPQPEKRGFFARVIAKVNPF